MAPSRWLSLFLAWILLLQSLAPALASPRPVRAPAPTQSAPHENHEYLVDTSQPYAEVIQERTWASNASGNATSDALIYRYDIGLDRLHYFKYQMPINGPPTLGSPALSEWLLFDGLGSTRALVGDSGSVVDEFGYNDAFGIPYRVTANGGGRAVAGPGFFLNGQQWDGGGGWGGSIWSGSPAFNSGEGLYFNRARYYQPGLGRFIGEDPFGGSDYEPNTLHRYLYAGVNPVNNIDPNGENYFTLSGLMTSIGIGAVVGGIGGGLTEIALNSKATLASIGQGMLMGALVGGAVGGAAYSGIAFLTESGLAHLVPWVSRTTTGIGLVSSIDLFTTVFADQDSSLSQKIAATGILLTSAFSLSPRFRASFNNFWKVVQNRVLSLMRAPMKYLSSPYAIDMRPAPGPTNAAGFPRNQRWFWREMLSKYPELFDAANRRLIQGNRAPVNNAHWRRYFPTHADGIDGEILIHHHHKQGPIATPIPQSLHRSFHTHPDLHPNPH